MFGLINALKKELKIKDYDNPESGSYIEFKNQEERNLFEKYLELGEKNGWNVEFKQTKGTWARPNTKEPYSAYDNVERIIVTIPGVNGCMGGAKREWDDNSSYRRKDNAPWSDFSFDVLENRDAVRYILNVAKSYQEKQDAIVTAEKEAEDERRRIAEEHKAEVVRIEKYIKRINELDGVGNEFSEQFKILREIESIGELNKKLLVNWKENVDKIHSLKKDFYQL